MSDAFKAIIVALQALEEAPRIALKRSELKIKTLVEAQFDEGRDPYGEPWAALAASTVAKGRTPPPLTDTGAMRKSLRVVASADGLTCSMAEPFKFHQYGTVNMPARPILPAEGVPPEWEKVITETVEEVIMTFPIYSALRR